MGGAPLVSPFSATRCAAYTYRVSHSPDSPSRGGPERQVLAQGFHLVPTRIAGASRTLLLGSLPSFETDLRQHADGRRWGREAAALFERLAGTARSAGQRERESRLLAARHGEIEEVHEDFVMGALGANVEPLTLEEDVLPVDQPVCVVGTCERGNGWLREGCPGARRGRGVDLRLRLARVTSPPARFRARPGRVERRESGWPRIVRPSGVLEV